MFPAVLITAIVIFDLALTALVIWGIVKIGWGPIMRAWPGCEPAPDAVVKRFQSFRFGVMNFGLCIHVAVDEGHLHLTPARLLRWAGAGPVSVPWESIAVERKARRGKWITASFEGRPVTGPAWCLDLAGPQEPPPEADAGTADR